MRNMNGIRNNHVACKALVVPTIVTHLRVLVLLTIYARMCQIENLFASNVIKKTFSPLLENVLMNDSGGGVGGEVNDIMLCRRKVYKCPDKYVLILQASAAAAASSSTKQ